MPLTSPAIARNQAAKNAHAHAARSPGTEATQIASHTRLKTTKAAEIPTTNPTTTMTTKAAAVEFLMITLDGLIAAKFL